MLTAPRGERVVAVLGSVNTYDTDLLQARGHQRECVSCPLTLDNLYSNHFHNRPTHQPST